MADKAFSARVCGQVQGVGFRYSAIQEAQRLGLAGWVRNADNGDVEVWAEGPQEKLSPFLAWLGRGPRYSHVDSVKHEDEDPKGYSNFTVKHC